MRNLVFVFLTLTLFDCRSSKTNSYVLDTGRFEIVEHSFKGDSFIDTTYFTNGNIESIGNYAIAISEEKTMMYVGDRKEYFGNGTLKSHGSYELSTYINCCYAGPCIMEYFYKTGKWFYHFPNGQLMATGIYLNKLEHINTSCKGGDYVMSNRITESWIFYDESGSKTEPSEKLIEQLEDDKYFFFN